MCIGTQRMATRCFSEHALSHRRKCCDSSECLEAFSTAGFGLNP